MRDVLVKQQKLPVQYMISFSMNLKKPMIGKNVMKHLKH
jgi:hypothetical protein